ncbi:MAG: hypothetical protein IJ017_04485 [Oscillospiraceae bacterium]|nr:hypothetical protein [Oscillospiraceae bacterium]
MDAKLRGYIRNVLMDNRASKLDELDAALTNEQASREFVDKKLGDYRDSLIAQIKFADWEDSQNAAPKN